MTLLKVESQTAPLSTFYINPPPYSIFTYNVQLVRLLIPHVLIEEAVLILLLWIVKVLLQAGNIHLEHLTYGGTKGEPDI